MSRRFTPESIGRTDATFETSTHLLRSFSPTRGSERLKIWAGVTDTGAANAIVPVLRILQPNHDIAALAREAGEAALLNSGLKLETTKHEPSVVLEAMEGNVVLTGLSNNPTLELLLNSAAYTKGIKSVALENFPGAYGPEFKTSLEDPFFRPDRIMVMNEWARNANLEALPWFKPEDILVTGQPAFDYIAGEDREEIKSKIYPELGLDNGEELVVFMGQKRGTPEAWQMVLDGLPKNLNSHLTMRRHPSDEVPMEAYEEMAGSMKSRLIRTDHFKTSEIGAIAGRVITIFSEEAMASIMRGIPTLLVLPPEVLALTEVPDVKVPMENACHVIRDSSENKIVIARLFNDDANAELQEPMALWRPDGKAGERVAQNLLALARG